MRAPKNPSQQDIDFAKQVLANAGYIQHYWHKEDINSIANKIGVKLTIEQMSETCRLLAKTDAENGINWTCIEYTINSVLGLD
jgi:phage tail sheath protein FI